MSEIITFGSATCDIFLKLDKDCFEWGDKVQAGDWQMEVGGGGVNAADTFALQGFETSYCGKVGDDVFGMAVIDNLKSRGVSLGLLKIDKAKKTALSFILSSPDKASQVKDRLVFAAQGACHSLDKDEINWRALEKAKCFYIAPLYGESVKLLEPLIAFAGKRDTSSNHNTFSRGIKIALNPGAYQIENYAHQLKHLISKADILILNLKEASMLADLPSGEEGIIIDKIQGLGVGIIVITKGEEGVLVGQGKTIYEAGVFPTNVVERTGAGDGFGSGFVAGLLQRNDIEYAIRLAMANSAACLGKVGAGNGLLKQGDIDKWPKLAIKRYEN